MLNIKINYYSHLLLTNKYSFVIKLAVLLCIYMLFTLDNTNEIAYCMKKKALAKAVVPTITETTSSTPIRPVGDIFELERMKVHEKIIAYTNMEPDQLIEGFKKWKAGETGYRSQPLHIQEKMYLQRTITGVLDPNYYSKIHYLFRMYRRLMGI